MLTRIISTAFLISRIPSYTSRDASINSFSSIGCAGSELRASTAASTCSVNRGITELRAQNSSQSPPQCHFLCVCALLLTITGNSAVVPFKFKTFVIEGHPYRSSSLTFTSISVYSTAIWFFPLRQRKAYHSLLMDKEKTPGEAVRIHGIKY